MSGPGLVPGRRLLAPFVGSTAGDGNPALNAYRHGIAAGGFGITEKICAEQSFEDLHNDRAKGVRLVNQSWEDEDVFEDPYWCTDMRHFQTYTYQGGFEGEDYYPPFSISGSGNTVSEELGTTLLAGPCRES